MGKYPPGLDVAIDYKFMDAVFERRSRRFGLGMEIEKGPLAYKSSTSRFRCRSSKRPS